MSSIEVRAGGRAVILSTVCYIPMLNVNLMSCSRLDENDITRYTSKRQRSLFDRGNNNELLGLTERRPLDGLYTALVASQNEKASKTASAAKIVESQGCETGGMETMHNRLSHASYDVVKKMTSSGK